MSHHTATVHWERGDARFTDNCYSRAHRWAFDGGADVPASSSPQVVRIPLSDPAAVDPEEAFVASLSSCHMLWFLSIAAARGFTVDAYLDQAEGRMARDEGGRLAMTEITLKPEVVFSGSPTPEASDVDAMHHKAHEQCFLANSVKTTITVAGTWRVLD